MLRHTLSSWLTSSQQSHRHLRAPALRTSAPRLKMTVLSNGCNAKCQSLRCAPIRMRGVFASAPTTQQCKPTVSDARARYRDGYCSLMARSGQYQKELRESQAHLRALRLTHSQLAVEHARMITTVCTPWRLHSICNYSDYSTVVMQISELEEELEDHTSPISASRARLDSSYATTRFSAEESTASRRCASCSVLAAADENHSPSSMMSIDDPTSAGSKHFAAELCSPPESCGVLSSALAAAAMKADGDASSPTRAAETPNCGQSPVSTFSFDSGSDVSLDEHENQPENQTPHGRLTVYTHGRKFTGRPSIAACAGRIPVISSGPGEVDPATVSTKGIRQVLHAMDGNSQDDSPAPAMRDSVTMMRRQELRDGGSMQLTISPDEL